MVHCEYSGPQNLYMVCRDFVNPNICFRLLNNYALYRRNQYWCEVEFTVSKKDYVVKVRGVERMYRKRTMKNKSCGSNHHRRSRKMKWAMNISESKSSKN